MAMDYFEKSIDNAYLIAVGYTFDQEITLNQGSTPYPIMIMYGGGITTNLGMLWSKFISSKPGFKLYGVAFSQAGTQFVTHTYNENSQDESLMVFTQFSATCALHVTYSQSSKGFDYLRRNLIFGSTRVFFMNKQGSYMNASPFILNSVFVPFNQAYCWSKLTPVDSEPLALTFGVDDSELFVYGNRYTTYYIAKLNANTGALEWNYGFEHTAGHQSWYMDYRSYPNTGGIIASCSGLHADVKVYTRIVIDATLGSPIDSETIIVSAPTLATFQSLQVRSLQIVDYDFIRVLLISAIEETVLIGNMNLKSMQIKYGQALPILQTEFFTLAKFSRFNTQVGVAYGMTEVAFTISGGSLPDLTLSGTTKSAAVYSTDPSETCYTAGFSSYVANSPLTLQSGSGGLTFSSLSTNYCLVSTTTTVFTQQAAPSLPDLDSTLFQNIDFQCLERPYKFSSVSPNPMVVKSPVGITNTITTPKATLQYVCSGTSPTLNSFTIDWVLPAGLAFDPLTGYITQQATLAAGIYTVNVYQTTNTNMKSSAQVELTIVQNTAPAFTSAWTESIIKIPINSSLQKALPAIFDADGNTVTVTAIELGKSTLPSYISLDPSTNIFTFAPTRFTQVGTKYIQVSLFDGYVYTKASFAVQVTNTAPYFSDLPTDQVVHLSVSQTYELPQAKDDEGNSVTYSCTQPTWAFFNMATRTFTFNPVFKTDLGESEIKVELTDGQYKTEYFFKVNVINDPPHFDNLFLDPSPIPLNSKSNFILPPYSDNENHPITVSSTFNGSPFLPTFMKYVEVPGYFQINPTRFSDVGNYIINLQLSDPYASQTYQLNVNIMNSAPIFVDPFSLIDQRVEVGTLKYIPLPAMTDAEGNEIIITTNEIGQPTLPSFMIFDPILREYQVFTMQKSDIGSYNIQVVLSDLEPMATTYSFQLQVIEQLLIPEREQRIANSLQNQGPPQFSDLNEHIEIRIEAGATFEFQLSKSADPDDDPYTYKFKYGDAFPFTEYDQQHKKFVFTPSNQQVRRQPYILEIRLQDQNKFFPKISQPYKLQLYVIQSQDSIQDDNDTTTSLDPSVIKQMKQIEALKEEQARASLKAISISRNGVLKLKVISAQFVPLLNEIRRDTVKIYLIKQSNMKEVNFTIIGIENNVLSIQLLFEFPEQVSMSQVRFWKSLILTLGV